MKTKRLYYVISALFCIVLLLTGLFICWQDWRRPFKTYDTSGLKISTCLRRIWPKLKKENIHRIIFCKVNTVKADEWHTSFEVPQECLDNTVKLLDKAICQSKIKYSMNIWGRPGLQIIADGAGLWGLPKLRIGITVIPLIGDSDEGLKIITDKGKYLTPVACGFRSIYGTDWASRELKEYLAKCGWPDPNN